MGWWLIVFLSVAHFNKDITGSWTNPSKGHVLFIHDIKKNSLQVKWKYDSDGTGPILLYGTGIIESINLHEAKINVPLNTVSFIINGNVCPTKSITFSSIARVTAASMIMRQCNMSFAFQCPHDIIRNVQASCDGKWE